MLWKNPWASRWWSPWRENYHEFPLGILERICFGVFGEISDSMWRLIEKGSDSGWVLEEFLGIISGKSSKEVPEGFSKKFMKIS